MTVEEAKAAVVDMLSANRFGDAGHTVVIEEFMSGEEASLLAFVDGTTVVPMMLRKIINVFLTVTKARIRVAWGPMHRLR